MTFIPSIDPAPYAAPLYWHNEATGELPAAVMAYLERHEVWPILAEYLHYWAYALAWRANPYLDVDDRANLTALVERACTLATYEEVSAWLNEALDWGIDPL